jgi:predicted MFS family arabinose efflux permease
MANGALPGLWVRGTFSPFRRRASRVERPPSTPYDPPVFNRRQVRLLFLGVLIITASTQPAFLVGAAFFQIGPEMGLGPVGLGGLTAVFFLTASVTSTPLGHWVQRVGWRAAIRVNSVVSALLMLSIGLFARSTWTLAALLLLAAAVYGMSNPAANLALARHTDPERAATVFGIKHAGIPSSTLLAGLAVPVVVIAFGWRTGFYASAALAAAMFFMVPRDEDTAAAERSARAPSRGIPLDRRQLVALGVVAGLGALAAAALRTYMVSAAIDEGFSEPAAGWLQFAGSAATITARVAIGVWFDRRRAHGFDGLLWLIGIGAVVIALIPLASGPAFASLVLVAYVTGWAWPGLMTYTVVDANRQLAASSSAITQAGTFVGAGAGPLLLGVVIERWSFDAAWLVVAVSLGLGAVLVRWVRNSVFPPAA